jgi:hypothetical protein
MPGTRELPPRFARWQFIIENNFFKFATVNNNNVECQHDLLSEKVSVF